MARLGGPFHLCQGIPKAFKEKRRFDNELHEFRRRLPSPVKNSTAQNWHKATQKLLRRTWRNDVSWHAKIHQRKCAGSTRYDRCQIASIGGEICACIV
jgi:hypothetical protein